MNQVHPAAVTAGIALTGAQIGQFLMWLCVAAHITPPPEAIAATMGAALLAAGHWAASAYLNRPAADPAPAPAPAPLPPTP